jgi:putative protease
MSEEKLIGKITHYFPKVGAAVVKLEGSLKVGDRIKLKRGEEEFEQEVQSMQIDHKDLKAAKKGEEVGLKVDQKVKEGWEVYKLIEAD